MPLKTTRLYTASGVTIKVAEVAHHRNGISGRPFYVVLFEWDPGDGPDRFVATIPTPFPASDSWSVECSVLSVSKLTNNEIAFGVNSWRGDQPYGALRRAIADFARGACWPPADETDAAAPVVAPAASPAP